MVYEFNESTEKKRNSLQVESTSNVTANAARISIMESADSTRRMYFDPVLVTNPKYPENSVEGTLVYEHKGKHDTSFPLDENGDFVSRQTIKKGDALKLKLRTEETRALYEGLQTLYKVYDAGGILAGQRPISKLMVRCNRFWRCLNASPQYCV